MERKPRPRIGQGPEARIRAHYRAMRHGYFVHEYGVGAMWLNLARRWRRPVQEIKRICKPSTAALRS